VSSPSAVHKPHAQRRWRPPALESISSERDDFDNSSEDTFEENAKSADTSRTVSPVAASMPVHTSCEQATEPQPSSAGGALRPQTPSCAKQPGLLCRAGKGWFGTPRCQGTNGTPLSTRCQGAAGTPMSTGEAERVHQLMELLQPGQPLGDLSEFAKAYGDVAFCRRLLRKYHNNLQKSSDRFKQALHWREQHRELIESRKFVHSGDYRVIGADLAKRPMLYMCYKNLLLPSSQCYDQLVVCMLQAIDNMPPGVETATHIWDLSGMRFRFSDLNPAPLIQMASTVEAYFAERMQDLVIIEMPRVAGFLKDALWPLISEKTKTKVKFLSQEQAGDYLQATCDEDVAGRILAVMAQNRDSRLSLEDRKSTWMRVDKQGHLVPAFA